MSAEENIAMARRGFAAMAAGDMAPLSGMFAADVPDTAEVDAFWA